MPRTLTARRAPGLALPGLALLCLGIGLWQLGGAGMILAKAWLAQQLLERAWARTLTGEDAVKPWPSADTWPVARLQVPALDVDLFVLAGASARTLAFGPARVAGTEGLDHSVLSGHRDTHFAFLQQLGDGGQFRLQDRSGAWQRYAVRGRSIVDARRRVIVRPGQGRRLLTLVTCYPFDSVTPGGPLRLAVTGEAVAGSGPAATDSSMGKENSGETSPGRYGPGEAS